MKSGSGNDLADRPRWVSAMGSPRLKLWLPATVAALTRTASGGAPVDGIPAGLD